MKRYTLVLALIALTVIGRSQNKSIYTEKIKTGYKGDAIAHPNTSSLYLNALLQHFRCAA